MRPLFELEKTAINVDWNVLKIKRVLDTPITDGPHETPELLDEGIPFLSAESVKKGKIDFNLKRGYISREDHEKYIKKCKPQRDDIFMIKSGATTGNVAMVETDEEFSIWSPLALIRADKEIIQPKYLYYFIGSAAFREQVEISWSFGTQQNIGMKVIENLFISIPPLHLQEKLVHYIEKKVVQIDKLIEMKELNIKLLEQQRQSIITEAVTKGLNPNVKMKDSGVEWIGEIPEHWDTKKIKYLIQEKLLYGANESAELDDEKLPRYIRITDIDELGNLKNETFKSIPLDIANKYVVKKGDILLARSGATVGKSYIHKEEKEASYAGYLIKLRARTLELAEYIYYFTNSSLYKQWINSILIQATIQNVSAEKYANLSIPVPNDENEIKSILLNIKFKEKEILEVINKLKEQIEKLKEYRQSLIYEAVTGKIDVRDMELD
ncbi:restriction endonuclease subunit S [Bacillus altitudinis]|uniref:restriction endonuclease subunit S n=1 Tax=Bacillus altitudinis TaxID=293387 RepID=UPI00203D02C3|nr:restriction endonuclease subunit S [Bacillus altitudinis]MCM3230897.1 restriction endonuclease subunit S [Bacillus altitudinis]